ncbi:MAG: HAD hydrolase-like protein [Clostridiales bacterium]|nr:HAD hydrolase-like protein [Clostridiales bacterium]
MKAKHIIWDWNGTLIEDTWLSREIANAMLAERGLPEFTCDADYRETFCFPVVEYYYRRGYTFEDESFDEVSDDYVLRYEANWPRCRLRPGTIAALQTARKAGLRQSVLSATRLGRLTPQLQYFGVWRYMERVLGLTDDLAGSKAHLAVQYFAEAGLKPEDVVFIGDTDHDFAVAQRVGSQCILLADGHQDEKVLKKCGAPVFETPLQAVEYILS